jgi:hypothetical protein
MFFHCAVVYRSSSLPSPLLVTAEGPLGIPGTTQTVSGYDTELGKDSICWSSFASATPDEGTPFPNGVLVEEFALADKVKLLPSCPEGTRIEAFAPTEFLTPGFRPRTMEWHTYSVKGSIDLSHLNGMKIVSDNGTKIAISMVACDSVRAGFCSPFVHDQANIREANEMAELGYTLYAPKKITGDRHGGTHVHAPAVLVDLVNSTSPTALNETRYDFDVEVPMIINSPGTFFLIGTLQFFTDNGVGVPTYRYDVANALTFEQMNDRLVTYQDPAEILEVSKPVQIISYVCVGVACAAISFLLLQSIKHYKTQVLQISQAPFLVVYLLAALVATASSVLFQPRSDLWCRLARPLVFISMQLFYSVTLGRLWRVHAVVSPLLKNRLQRARSSKRGFGGRFSAMTCCPSRRVSLRKEISNSKVVGIVAMCTLPQIVLQVLGLVLQPAVKSIEYNEDESVGRCVCDDGVKIQKSIQFYSLCVLGILVLVLLIMAHIARQLPSLLNESRVIYDSTLSSVLLMILGIGVIAVTNSPTTSPNVSYMVYVILVLSSTLNSSLRIMLPKLKMAWNGQVILVSKLVSDHRQRLDSSCLTGKDSLMHNVTGITPGSSWNGAHSSPRTSTGFEASANSSKLQIAGTTEAESHCVTSKLAVDVSNETDREWTGDDENEVDKHDSSTSSSRNSQCPGVQQADELEGDDGHCGDDKADAIHGHQATATGERKAPLNNANVKFNVVKEPTKLNASGKRKKATLKVGQVPSRNLTMKMLDLQQELDLVTNHIMSGLSVDPTEWEKVRKYTEELDEVFSLIQFDWERYDHTREADVADV